MKYLSQKEGVIAYYATVANTYSTHTHPHFWNVCDAILAYLLEKWILASPSPSPLMDLGGGTGKWAAWFAEKGVKQPIVADISEEMLSLVPNCSKPVFADAEHLPFNNEEFGGIVCLNNVIGLLSEPKLGLDEMARVLRKDGRIAISYCTRQIAEEYLKSEGFFKAAEEVIDKGIFHSPWGEYDIRAFSRDEFDALVKRSGLIIAQEHSYPMGLMPTSEGEHFLSHSENLEKVLSFEMIRAQHCYHNDSYQRLALLKHRDE